jgi:hypothetical protein
MDRLSLERDKPMSRQDIDGPDQFSSGTQFDLDDAALRVRISPTAFKAFDATADFLSLSMSQRRKLLGTIPAATYRRWRTLGAPTQTRESLERMSLVFGIVRALRTVFSDDTAVRRWLTGMNRDAPFCGASPLDQMLRGSTSDLRAVRRYTDSWLRDIS